MRIIGAGYVGDIAVGAKVVLPFQVLSPGDEACQLTNWSGLVCVVAPDGESTEQGVSFLLNQPVSGLAPVQESAPGNHAVVVDTSNADGAFLFTPGRDYRVLVFGDPVDGVEIQGRCIGHFSIRNR